MKYKVILILVFIFLYTSLIAQDIKLGIQTGYGFYNMNSISSITEQTKDQLFFESKIISNYPTYHYYQPMLKFSHNNFDYGLIYRFQTTGSRISSKDYSGEYALDSKINGHCPGVILNGIFQDHYLYKVGFVFQAGVNFSVLKIDEQIKIDTIAINSNYRYLSHSFYIEPGINIIFPWNRYFFEFNIGFYKEFERNDYVMKDDEQNKILLKENYEDFDMWDGLRLGISISYTLYKKKKD